MSKNPNRAQSVELEWDGSSYTATLTDHNRVLSDYSFSANEDGISFSVSGNQLVITATDAPSDSVKITANKVGSTRRGIITWTDGTFNQGSGKQDVITYAQSVSDPVQAFLNLKVSYGSAKIVKTSEDGKVDNLTFTVTGNGINQTVKTNSKGEIQIDNLMPGVYTVTEMDYDKYEPQESRRVTVVSGQVSTVTFNNKLKRGDLQIVKSSEDNLNEGVTFHLYGTSLSGIAVDEYAVTDANGVATFEDVLISGSTPYTVEEVDTAVRYVVPEAQSAPINWNEVTNRSFLNILKKFSVTVTKSDVETSTAQGDASLAGAVYGIYKGETLVDTYTTDKNGQFVTKEYICDNDWTVREITPSEGYLLDTTVHKVGAEPQLYTVEHNQTANDVTEQVAKGNIAIIKHTDNGDTQIETPESGAEFAVYLKAAGSYEVAEDTERDYLTCDENGFAQTKDMPIGMLVVLDSILNRITQNRAKGKNTFIFIDEIYLLFQHEYSANFLFTLWKRVRKYGAYATGITQNVDDLLQSHTARTMLANSEFIVMLNQASTDRLELAKLLNISDTQLSYITNVDAGHGLIKVGSSLVPFANKFPKNTKLYKLMTTKPGEGA